MLLFERPDPPDGFDKAVAATRDRIAEAVKSGKHLTSDDDKDDFPPLWRKYKTYFAKAQYNKCGFCESCVLSVYVGDVEHYRPKGAIERLPSDRARWGRERPNSALVEGRSLDPLCDSGYFWLAYDWSNYLLACQPCNQYWKKCLFPVDHEDRRAIPPTADAVAAEQPLLLNPFGPHNPVMHLHFDKFGQVMAWKESRHGYATIHTCGLDRETLRMSRSTHAAMAYRLAGRLKTAYLEDDEATMNATLGDFGLIGRTEAAHAGMVRAIFEHETELSWGDCFPEPEHAGA